MRSQRTRGAKDLSSSLVLVLEINRYLSEAFNIECNRGATRTNGEMRSFLDEEGEIDYVPLERGERATVRKAKERLEWEGDINQKRCTIYISRNEKKISLNLNLLSLPFSLPLVLSFSSWSRERSRTTMLPGWHVLE